MVSSDTALTNDTLYVVLGSVLGGLTILVILLVTLYHCRQRNADRGESFRSRESYLKGQRPNIDIVPFDLTEHDRTVWNGKPIANENGNTITVSPSHQYIHHHHLHKMHNGFADQHRSIYADDRCSRTENDETAETSFCDGTRRSSGDLLRSTDSLSRHSLKRGYMRNGSIPSLHQQQQQSAGRKVGDSNTLPLLMHQKSGHRDPCIDDAEWEASVPPADSEKFI